jgi:hypothetical protein
MHSIYTKKNQRVVAGPGTSALPPPTSTMDKDSATGDDDDNETETTKPASLEAKEGGKSNDAKGKDFLEGNELGNETEVNGETNKEEDTARERDNDKKPESLPNESASDEEIEESRPAKRKADSGAKRNDQDRQDEGLLKEDVKKKKTKTVEEDSMPSMKFPGVFVTETNDRDVLQGRGSGSNLYQGNMVYRDMIEEVATSYTSTTSRKEKNRLVNELITVIHGMNGRFLHPVDNDEAVKLGLDPSKDFFYEITDADAVDKVKQAIRYVHYKKRPLMEQRRKAAAQRGESSSMLREDDRKMPTRPVSVDESSNTDPAIQQLLRNLPSGTSTAAPSRVQSGNSVSSQPFHLLHQQLLLQQQLQGSDTTSSQVGSNTLADVLEGLQHQRQGDQGGLQRMLQQQMLLQQLRQLQLEQEQSRQQQQQLLQTLIHMQPEQRVDQQALLSALATASGQQQGSTSTRPPAHSSQLFSSLLVRVIAILRSSYIIE